MLYSFLILMSNLRVGANEVKSGLVSKEAKHVSHLFTMGFWNTCQRVQDDIRWIWAVETLGQVND